MAAPERTIEGGEYQTAKDYKRFHSQELLMSLLSTAKYSKNTIYKINFLSIEHFHR
jgi:hypothetical protein